MNANTTLATMSDQVDYLIFAPHPDDEVLACGGLILNAQLRDEKIKIVFFTNGDGNSGVASTIFQKPENELTAEDYSALGHIRQREALEASARMGVAADDLLFLGYPDGALTRIYKAEGKKLSRSKYTNASHTQGPFKIDYHSATHGVAAPYVKESVLEDVSSIISTFNPKKIYVPAEFDTHPDHCAAFWYVRDSIKRTQHLSDIFIYLVHGGNEGHWPFPRGKTPHHQMEQCESEGILLPISAPWPPSNRMPISLIQNEHKFHALAAHTTQLIHDEDKEYLESFIKNEEIFWQIDPRYYPNW